MKIAKLLITLFTTGYALMGFANSSNMGVLSHDSLGVSLKIPITVTRTNATQITSFSSLLSDWSNTATCTGSIANSFLSGGSGSFNLASGTSVIYISTIHNGAQLCNTGSLTRAFSLNAGNVNTSSGACTSSSGCVTVVCSNSSTVSSISSTLTLTCP